MNIRFNSIPFWMQYMSSPDDTGGAGADVLEKPDGGAGATGADGGARSGDDTGDGGEGRDSGAGDDGGLLGSGSDDDRKVVVQADWPEDWRAKMAGENQKALKALERYGDPAKVAEALLAAQQKISSGEYKKALTDDASDEEKAEALKEMGVPEDWKDYEIPDDLSVVEFDGGPDDPMLSTFLEEMHGVKAPKEVVAQALRAFDKLTAQQQEAQVEGDKSFRLENEDRLRAQWGDDFRPRVTLYQNVLNRSDSPLPRPVAEALSAARDGNGNRLINHAAVADWLVQVGLEEWGEGSLVTGGELKAQQSRIDEIKQIMRTDMNRYWQEGLDKEYAKLIEAEQRRR